MKYLLIIIALTCTTSIFSQTVNGIPLKDIDVNYIQIVGTSKMMSTKITIALHFGQQDKLWSNKDTQLKDENGAVLVFNSMIDALNYLSNHGYEFEAAYAITISNQNIYHYLLKKVKE
jgi:hypothetical protein